MTTSRSSATRSTLAALALAIVPVFGTPAALADEGDAQTEGAQEPEAVRSPDPADNPDFRPPTGPRRGNEDGGPVVDTDAPTNDAEGDPVEEGETPPPQPLAAPVPPPTPPAPPATAPTPPVPPAPPPAAPSLGQPPVLVAPDPTPPVKRVARKPSRQDSRPRRSPQPVPRRARPLQVPAQLGSSPTRPDIDVPRTREIVASKSDVAYTVRPGDSLWAIAQRLAGPRVSPAEVARMVERLWQLNREQIGTGSPDMLNVGTELRLPS